MDASTRDATRQNGTVACRRNGAARFKGSINTLTAALVVADARYYIS